MPHKSNASAAKYYSINASGDGPAEILIYDVIGQSWWEESVTAKQFVKDLKAIGAKKDVVVRINSPGGNVFDGNAIFNALKNHKGKVDVVVDGMALSMASIIAMAGDTITMSDNAIMMIHNPSGLAVGDANAMRTYADLLDKIKSPMVDAYVARSGKQADEIAALMDAETWFNAEEAKAFGFADAIVESNLAVAAQFDESAIAASGVNVPKEFAKRVAAFAKSPVSQEKETMSEPTTPKAATVAELQALGGADSDFIVAQLSKNATLEQATAALNAKLTADLAAAKTQLAEANKKIVDAEAEAKKKATAGHGVEPVSSGSQKSDGLSLGTADGSGNAWGDDAIGFYKRELAKAMNDAPDAMTATTRVTNAHKGLAEAMREQAMSAAGQR